MDVRAAVQELPMNQRVIWNLSNLKIDDPVLMDHIVHKVEALAEEGLVRIKSVDRETRTGRRLRYMVTFERVG